MHGSSAGVDGKQEAEVRLLVRFRDLFASAAGGVEAHCLIDGKRLAGAIDADDRIDEILCEAAETTVKAVAALTAELHGIGHELCSWQSMCSLFFEARSRSGIDAAAARRAQLLQKPGGQSGAPPTAHETAARGPHQRFK